MNRLAAPLVLLACCAGCGSATKRSSLSSEISTRESLTSAVIAGSGRPSPDMTFAPTTASTSTVPVDTSWLEPFATGPPRPFRKVGSRADGATPSTPPDSKVGDLQAWQVSGAATATFRLAGGINVSAVGPDAAAVLATFTTSG